jgi:hypothetical protein
MAEVYWSNVMCEAFFHVMGDLGENKCIIDVPRHVPSMRCAPNQAFDSRPFRLHLANVWNLTVHGS